MRSSSDASCGRRGGRSLFALLPLPVSKWVCTNGRLTGEIGVRPASRSAPAPPRSQRSGFIKNTSVTAGKQMAGPELLRPCGRPSFAFVPSVLRSRCSLFSGRLLTYCLREGNTKVIPWPGKKKEEKISWVIFFFLLLLLPGSFRDTLSFLFVRKRTEPLLHHCGCEAERGVVVKRGGVLPARLRSLI